MSPLSDRPRQLQTLDLVSITNFLQREAPHFSRKTLPHYLNFLMWQCRQIKLATVVKEEAAEVHRRRCLPSRRIFRTFKNFNFHFPLQNRQVWSVVVHFLHRDLVNLCLPRLYCLALYLRFIPNLMIPLECKQPLKPNAKSKDFIIIDKNCCCCYRFDY